VSNDINFERKAHKTSNITFLEDPVAAPEAVRQEGSKLHTGSGMPETSVSKPPIRRKKKVTKPAYSQASVSCVSNNSAQGQVTYSQLSKSVTSRAAQPKPQTFGPGPSQPYTQGNPITKPKTQPCGSESANTKPGVQPKPGPCGNPPILQPKPQLIGNRPTPRPVETFNNKQNVQQIAADIALNPPNSVLSYSKPSQNQFGNGTVPNNYGVRRVEDIEKPPTPPADLILKRESDFDRPLPPLPSEIQLLRALYDYSPQQIDELAFQVRKLILICIVCRHGLIIGE
jgi:hypothetical protein